MIEARLRLAGARDPPRRAQHRPLRIGRNVAFIRLFVVALFREAWNRSRLGHVGRNADHDRRLVRNLGEDQALKPGDERIERNEFRRNGVTRRRGLGDLDRALDRRDRAFLVGRQRLNLARSNLLDVDRQLGQNAPFFVVLEDRGRPRLRLGQPRRRVDRSSTPHSRLGTDRGV